MGINALRFAIGLSYVAFSAGLVQQQQHEHRHCNKDQKGGDLITPPSVAAAASRRTFGIVSAASLSSLLIGGEYSASADPLNAFIPVGSRMLQQQAFIQSAEGWATPKLSTELGASRIGTSPDRSMGPLQGSPSPFASKDVFYPPVFVGDWNVKATLKQKTFPFGPDFVLSRSLRDGSPRYRGEQVGNSTSYVARFVSSGNSEQPQAIADRPFNLVSMSRSYQQLTPVIADSIQWDPKKDPTRLAYQRESVTSDMRPVGPIKAEVYLTARKTEDSAANQVFCSAERSRTVTIGTGSVTADDSEIITEFQTIDEDTIRAVSRFAVYLTPNPNSMEGVLWQQVSGKAVAFYDYELLMERKKE